METVNTQEAKTQLSRLLAAVEAGETVTIARAGRPIARLVPVQATPPRRFGTMSFVVPEDFDAPLSQDALSEWE